MTQNTLKKDRLPKYKFSGSKRTIKRKIAYLGAITETFGHIGKACEKLNLERRTYYRWLEKDKEFKRACDELEELDIDTAELMLKSQINKADMKAITFFLRSKGKHRGWVERSEVQHSVESGGININLIERSVEEIKNAKTNKSKADSDKPEAERDTSSSGR